ncbi:MAG TPA: hypothetical protein VMV83_01865 [Rectinemataceae bacterium]|nr:hypothetical protein [Rectinemataceae bacterium]
MSGFFDSPLPLDRFASALDVRLAMPTLASLLPPTPPRLRRP